MLGTSKAWASRNNKQEYFFQSAQYLFLCEAALDEAGELPCGDVALAGEPGLRDLEEVGEDEELLESEGPVGVGPVVHRGVVGDLVGAGALPVGWIVGSKPKRGKSPTPIVNAPRRPSS